METILERLKVRYVMTASEGTPLDSEKPVYRTGWFSGSTGLTTVAWRWLEKHTIGVVALFLARGKEHCCVLEPCRCFMENHRCFRGFLWQR